MQQSCSFYQGEKVKLNMPVIKESARSLLIKLKGLKNTELTVTGIEQISSIGESIVIVSPTDDLTKSHSLHPKFLRPS